MRLNTGQDAVMTTPGYSNTCRYGGYHENNTGSLPGTKKWLDYYVGEAMRLTILNFH